MQSATPSRGRPGASVCAGPRAEAVRHASALRNRLPRAQGPPAEPTIVRTISPDYFETMASAFEARLFGGASTAAIAALESLWPDARIIRVPCGC